METMRTIVNMAGTTYDALKTSVIFAEDMNAIKTNIETLFSDGVGTTWYTGSGVPDNGVGANGDFYLRSTNGDVYVKSAGTWSVSLNIKGATGDTGATGSTGATGDTGATGPQGPANTLYTQSDASTVTFDIDTNGGLQKVVLGGNRTLAVTCSTNRAFVLVITQDGTGTRVPTWFSGISWAGGSAPTLTTTLNKTDTFGFIRTGSGAYLGFVVGLNS